MAKTAAAPKPVSLDPDNHSARLYRLITKLIDKLETDKGVTVKELYMALSSISRMQLYCQQFRIKESKTDEPTAGSAVRKYTTAFTAHDARRRKALAGDDAADTGDDDLPGLDDDEDRDTA